MVAVETLWKSGWKRSRASFASLAQLVSCLGLRVWSKAAVSMQWRKVEMQRENETVQIERYEKIWKDMKSVNAAETEKNLLCSFAHRLKTCPQLTLASKASSEQWEVPKTAMSLPQDSRGPSSDRRVTVALKLEKFFWDNFSLVSYDDWAISSALSELVTCRELASSMLLGGHVLLLWHCLQLKLCHDVPFIFASLSSWLLRLEDDKDKLVNPAETFNQCKSPDQEQVTARLSSSGENEKNLSKMGNLE